MWRAKYKKRKGKEEVLVLGVFLRGGFFLEEGGRETDLRSGEVYRFGR